MGLSNAAFVSASVVLTLASLAVGMSFFGPYWLSNVSRAYTVETAFVNRTGWMTRSNISVWDLPDRGLWAQCGLSCMWFWSENYGLQVKLLTPLKWHLATQVLYFVGATFILFCEFYARFQICCRPRRGVYISLSILLFVSALIQTAAIAVFGGGASRYPYNALSNPTVFTKYLGHAYAPLSVPVYLGWCFWMAVVGSILTVVAAILFMLASCCRNKADY